MRRITNEMYEVHQQSIREVFVRISLLQNYFVQKNGNDFRRFKKVGEIQGNTIDGNIDIDTKTPIRRMCNLELYVTDSSFHISKDSKIWLDKWFKLEIGVKHFKNNNIIWFDKGIFAINNPNIDYDSTSKILNLDGIDLMGTLDGTLGGGLGYETKIDAETPLTDAVKNILELGNIDRYYIEENNLDIPYDIEMEADRTIYDLLEKIRDLYMNYEIYFDLDGRFIYRRIEGKHVSDPYDSSILAYDFLENNDLIIDYNLNYDFENVRNKIYVYGRMLDNGTQIMSIKENEDQNSPFNIDSEFGIIPYVYMDDEIQVQEQADERANYELYMKNNFNERLDLELVPIYFLDVNQLIEVDNFNIGLKGRFNIDSISMPIRYDGTMSISAHRVYPSN